MGEIKKVTKVWVVTRFNYEATRCVGVFSSDTLALAFIRAFPDTENYAAEQWTVDSPEKEQHEEA